MTGSTSGYEKHFKTEANPGVRKLVLLGLRSVPQGYHPRSQSYFPDVHHEVGCEPATWWSLGFSQCHKENESMGSPGFEIRIRCSLENLSNH